MDKPNRPLSIALVVGQFGFLLALLLSGPIVARNPWLLAMQTAGTLVGLWGVAAMRITRVSVLPEVRGDAQLVTAGPYRWIRHPMYSGLLLIGLAVLLDAPALLRLALWLGLLITLIIKLSYEENLLSARFPEYAAYRRRTWRIVPLVF